jgi:hypothetical protein
MAHDVPRDALRMNMMISYQDLFHFIRYLIMTHAIFNARVTALALKDFIN